MLTNLSLQLYGITKSLKSGQLFIFYNKSRANDLKLHISQVLIELIPEVPDPVYVP